MPVKNCPRCGAMVVVGYEDDELAKCPCCGWVMYAPMPAPAPLPVINELGVTGTRYERSAASYSIMRQEEREERHAEIRAQIRAGMDTRQIAEDWGFAMQTARAQIKAATADYPDLGALIKGRNLVHNQRIQERRRARVERRRAKVVKLHERKMSVMTIAEMLGVSEQTIRKDLWTLGMKAPAGRHGAMKTRIAARRARVAKLAASGASYHKIAAIMGESQQMIRKDMISLGLHTPQPKEKKIA